MNDTRHDNCVFWFFFISESFQISLISDNYHSITHFSPTAFVLPPFPYEIFWEGCVSLQTSTNTLISHTRRFGRKTHTTDQALHASWPPWVFYQSSPSQASPRYSTRDMWIYCKRLGWLTGQFFFVFVLWGVFAANCHIVAFWMLFLVLTFDLVHWSAYYDHLSHRNSSTLSQLATHTILQLERTNVPRNICPGIAITFTLSASLFFISIFSCTLSYSVFLPFHFLYSESFSLAY